MGILMFIICVLPTIVTPITVSPNGNSPEIKMVGGMMVDVKKEHVPLTTKAIESTTETNFEKGEKLNTESNKLSINERYRRLIPYMTFYYANDLIPTTEGYKSANVQVEKAEIVEARMIQHREPKKIIYAPQRNIPRYQGNRLTQFNIASANPTKVYYKEVPVYQNSGNFNHNPIPDHGILFNNHDLSQGRFGQKQIIKSPSIVHYTPTTRKPYLNLYSNDDSNNLQYYIGNKEHSPKYKLVPYEQTPPYKTVQQSEPKYEQRKPIPVPVLIPKEPVYIKPRPLRPQYIYDENIHIQPVLARKLPAVVSETYYENHRLSPSMSQTVNQPIVENGFKPIISPLLTTETPEVHTILSPTTSIPQYQSEKKPVMPIIEPTVHPVAEYTPHYYQYVEDQPVYRPEEDVTSNTMSLSDLLNSLQLNKSIPKTITKDNVSSSIRTLLQVLNTLKAMSQSNDVDIPSVTPKPVITPEILEVTPVPVTEVDLNEESYLAPVHTPSQHLDDSPSPGRSSQHFPLHIHSDEEGGTPGRPGVDYPVLTVIPPTSFDCKTQRYKGFFADTETRCQVWHYCDLNGGQASFLCPNGTIFSQAGLTCDWWFNVRCDSTTQLYVLNESLYKFILPHSPKFPEDYSGPLVDKYLTLKFKEMEEQFKKNKNKQSASEKADSDEREDSDENTSEREESKREMHEESIHSGMSAVSEASVVIESPGKSGNVERLQD